MIHLVSSADTYCSDLAGIYDAIAAGRKEKNKPTIIRLTTIIGFGSKQQGTHGVHGTRMFRCLFLYTLATDNIEQLSKPMISKP